MKTVKIITTAMIDVTNITMWRAYLAFTCIISFSPHCNAVAYSPQLTDRKTKQVKYLTQGPTAERAKLHPIQGVFKGCTNISQVAQGTQPVRTPVWNVNGG